MRIWLIRHGFTALGEEKRYQGSTDTPLSDAGRHALQPDDRFARVCCSPLLRAVETAEILFPNAEKRMIPDLREMDFGVFDGRTADEMADDADYRAWVDGDCTAQCPGGESRAAFCERSCAAFEKLLERSSGDFAIVAHGGTLRAVMERYALPEKDYFDWMSGNGGGYRLEFDEALWRERRKLRLLERISFVREGGSC